MAAKPKKTSTPKTKTPAAKTDLSAGVTADKAPALIDSLQKRADAGTIGANDKARLDSLKQKFPAASSGAQGTTGGTGGAGTTTGGSGGTTTTSDGTSTTTATTPALTNDQKWQQVLDKGTSLGNSLTDQLGLRGEFLGRVNTDVGADYTNDLNNVRTRLATASDPTALDQEALTNARNALPGLDASENSALRSAAVADLNRTYGQQQQQLLRYQGGIGSPIQRASQISALGGQRVEAQRGLARDLLVANIQAKQQARDSFSNLTNTVGQRADTRTAQLSGLVQAGDQYADTYKQSGQEFNTGSQGTEVAARTGALVGGLGTASSLYGGFRAEDFQNTALVQSLAEKDKEIQANKDIAKQTLDAQDRIFKSLGGNAGGV